MRKLLVSSLTALFLLLAGCNQGSKPISVAVVSPTGAQALDIGQSFNISVQVNNDKLAKGATFSMSGVGALSGQTATGATYTAPASGAGGNATITITSASDPTKTITLNVVVTAPPSISNASSTLTAGIQGVAYNTSVTETGGAGTLTYSVTLGSLPAGLTLNSSTGAITGSPTGTGTSTFTVQVKDSSTSAPQTSSKSFTITVNQQPTITSANTTTFVAGTPGTFSVTVTATPNGAITITETGSLPTGITFVDNGNGTATLAGTTSTTGSFPITISAANGIGTAASQNFTLVVGKAPAISSANASTFTVGSAGTFAVTTTGYPAPTLAESGALPSGVTFTDNKNGTATLAGTPAANSGGKYTFTVTASNSLTPNATQSFTLTVDQAPAITSGNSTTFTINTLGTFTVTTNTSSYPAAALSESGALPAGVTFVDNGNGKATLAGTPTVSGSFPITITANNGVSPNATQNFTLTVGQAAAITSSTATTFTVGSVGTFNVTTTGFPAPTLSESGALPSGVTFHDNGNGTATLSGTPAANTGGKFTFTITAHNGIGADGTQSFTLTVNQAPAITSAGATTFSVSAAGSFTVTTTGFPAPALSESGALPTGVTFVDNGNGKATLSGTASAPGTFNITITAANGVGSNATQAFTLTVNTAPAVTSANNTTFTVGAAGAFTVTTTGTPTPSLSESGALPSGVTFVDNHNGTATLAGTPAANTGATYSVTITATNSVGSTNQSFTLTVDQSPAITSANSTSFTIGSSSSFTVMTSGVPKPALSESGALPSGVTFVDNGNGTATLSGNPASATAGSYPITITANNGVAPNGTQTFTLTVNTLPVFSTGNSTTFTAGTSGSFTVTASGSPTFTETGALPSGVTFTDNGGGSATLAGTPAANTGGTYNFTIKATNGTGTTSQSFTLTVDQAPSITSSNTATFAVGQLSTFNVGASGFPSPNITESGTLPTGVTFNTGTGSLSGTPATGTAGSYPITFTASNGIGSNATQNFTLVVILDPCTGAGTGSESLLNGQYAFVLKGFDNGTGATETQPEPALVGGVLTFNGSGSITAGTLDQNLYNTTGVLSQAVTSGTYKVGSDHRACMDITTTAGTTHYRASLANISSGVASLGHMIDFDPSGPFVSGIMKKQTTSAFGTGSSQVSGNYAFSVSSIDNTNQCNNAGAYCKFAAIGVFKLSAGSVTGGEVDFNENGQLDNTTAWPASPVSIASGGTYSVSSTTGRGTLVFKPSSPSNVTAIIYVVSSTDLLVLTSDDQTQNSLFAGELLQQSGAPFSANPLSGAYVGYQSGLSTNVTGASRETLLLLNASGANISGTQYRNDAGSFQDKPLSGITYSVASTGRMTVIGGSNPPIFYLVSSSEAFSLGGDNATETGVFQSQTGGPFSGTTVSGSYAFGTIEPEVSGSNISDGIAVFANPNINVTEDDNSNGSLTVGGTQSFTYTVDATGLISIPSSGSSCTISSSSTTCQTLLFIISPAKAVIMDTQSSNPKTQLGDK